MANLLSMKSKYKWIISIIVVLLISRFALPYIAVNRINIALDEIEGYHGSVMDVHMNLYRGGFIVENLAIFEEASESPEIPLVDLRYLDFSIEWRALFKGEFVGEAYLDTLLINFVKLDDDVEIDSTNNRGNLIEEIQKLNPIQLNIVEVKNAQVYYKDPTTSPNLNVELTKFYLKAENLGNVVDEQDELPASMLLAASSIDSGQVNISAQMNVLKDPPDFDYNVKIENLNMVQFNDFFDEKMNIELASGKFNLYSEGKAKDGQLVAYAKPLVLALSVAEADTSDSIIKKVYTGVVDFGVDVLTNSDEDQTGTKIPIEGTFEKADPQIFTSIINFFKNAFFEAYLREIEHTIEFQDSNNTNDGD